MTHHPLALEHQLIADYQAGDILSGDRIVGLYEGLIVNTVRQYVSDRCELEDLLQVGRMALLDAAKKHDSKLGRLSTYAFHYIRWEANDYARRQRHVVHVSEGAARRGAAPKTVWLDAPLPSGKGTLVDMMAAPQAVESQHVVDTGALLGVLPERQQAVMRRLYCDAPETLEQIGASLGVTKERVRQLKEEALEKMRRAARLAGMVGP